MTNLQLRILTAFIYFPLLLVSANYPEFFELLMIVLLGAAWNEFLRFRSPPFGVKGKVQHILLILLGVLPLVFDLVGIPFYWAIVMAGISLQAAMISSLCQGGDFRDSWEKHQFFVLGYLYMTGLVGSMVALNQMPNGPQAVWFLLFVVGISDSGAYFTGKKFGATPFFEHLSPTKTWEGFFGGLVLAGLGCVAFYYIFGYFSFVMPKLVFLIPLGLLVSIVSTGGDLFESGLKRQYGVKDSGKSLPGHGGVLDRFDGVIMGALPLLFYMLVRGGFS